MIYALISSTGLFFLKNAAAPLTSQFFLGAILYVTGAFMWIIMLRAYPISFIFPVSASFLIISTSLIGYLLLSEKFNILNILALFFIILGIFLLSYSKKIT